MLIKNESAVIHLREKISGVDRKKSQSEDSQKVQGNAKSEIGTETEKHFIADVIGIRNENRLAASSNSSIKSEEAAFDMVEELKKQFESDSENAMNAHKKANPDAVMQFYPFE